MSKYLVISDLHVGSEAGLAPNEYIINDHTIDRSYKITANKTQERLYEIWQEMIDNEGKVDGLFLLGDLCDGDNRRGSSVGITHSDIGWQVDLAYDLIKEIPVKYGAYYSVQGSTYHVLNANGLDWSVTKRLTQNAHSKFVFGDDIVQEIDGFKVHARHVTGYSKIPELRKNRFKADLVEFFNEYKSLGKIDIAIRGHVHYHEMINWGEYLVGSICPCLKAPDSFIRQKSIISPQYGYLTIEINNGGFEVIPHLFKL